MTIFNSHKNYFNDIRRVFRESEKPDLSLQEIVKALRDQGSNVCCFSSSALYNILLDMIAGRILICTGSNPALYTLIE